MSLLFTSAEERQVLWQVEVSSGTKVFRPPGAGAASQANAYTEPDDDISAPCP